MYQEPKNKRACESWAWKGEDGSERVQAGYLSIWNEKGYKIRQYLIWSRKNGKDIKQIQKKGRLMVAAVARERPLRSGEVMLIP